MGNACSRQALVLAIAAGGCDGVILRIEQEYISCRYECRPGAQLVVLRVAGQRLDYHPGSGWLDDGKCDRTYRAYQFRNNLRHLERLAAALGIG